MTHSVQVIYKLRPILGVVLNIERYKDGRKKRLVGNEKQKKKQLQLWGSWKMSAQGDRQVQEEAGWWMVNSRSQPGERQAQGCLFLPG